MKARLIPRGVFRTRFSLLYSAWIFGLLLALELAVATAGLAQTQPRPDRTAPISAAEFSRLIQELSEPGGYFHSDNFTSNETSYLHVLGKLKELGISGGAYLGVGPEQNFSYIAKVRPQIAFIVDIRRQAVLQHLLYKAVFHLGRNRAQFLSLLFSKPLPQQSGLANGSLEQIIKYFGEAPTTRQIFVANLAAIRRTIERDFRFPLSSDDVQTLEYVYNAFWQGNLRISFRFGTGAYSYSYGFPTLKDLILATDLNGDRGNFLAAEEDYQFLRDLQEQNRVIPVIGDFAGTKALAAVANYLRRKGYTLSAFYTSNVEQFLYQNEVFDRYAENVAKFPISSRSVFIRATRGAGYGHPARVPGHRLTTILQKVSIFLEDYKEGLYPTYGRLVTTHFIAGTPTRVTLPATIP